MAVELEETIMREIGLVHHYSWYNGSGSCAYIAREAVDRLGAAMEKHGLTLSPQWLAHCKKALRVDRFGGGEYTLTNTWVTCSYAIQDGIYRSEGGQGFDPVEDWHFWSEQKRREWERMQNFGGMFNGGYNERDRRFDS